MYTYSERSREVLSTSELRLRSRTARHLYWANNHHPSPLHRSLQFAVIIVCS